MTNAMMARRAFLRGTGVALALPWLESLAVRMPFAPKQPPVRMAILVTPNGVLPSSWLPERTATGWQPSFTLLPLQERVREVSVLTGLANRGSFDGDGHYAKVAPLLTGKTIRRTGGRDLLNGVSMDQVAARVIGGRTLLPSLELGCDPIYAVEDGRDIPIGRPIANSRAYILGPGDRRAHRDAHNHGRDGFRSNLLTDLRLNASKMTRLAAATMLAASRPYFVSNWAGVPLSPKESFTATISMGVGRCMAKA